MRFVHDIVRLGAKRHGEKTALVHEGQSLSYRQLDAAAGEVAAGLVAAGVGVGDRVGVFSANCAEYVVLLFASAKCGAVLQTINQAYLADELAHVINDAAPKILFAGAAQCELVESCRPRFQAQPLLVQLAGAARPGWRRYRSLLSGPASHRPEFEADEDTPVALMYTSGTTGTPKGVLFSNRSLMGTAYSVIVEGDVEGTDFGMVNLPLFHAAGIFAMTVPLLMQGASQLLLSGSFDAEKVLGLVERHRITLVMWVPTMLAMLVNTENVGRYDLSSLKKLYYGASPIPSAVYERVRSVFAAGLYQFYGQTESGLVAVLRPEDHADKALCTGREMLNCEIRIVDEAGADVAEGEVGEIICRSNNTMKGYLNNPQATAETVRDGWVYTGDLARAGERGYFTIVGRAKDMIISGAENIYPREVEEVIGSHPAVAEVAVFGIPDEVYGESVCAAIVIKPGCAATAAEIQQHCTARMSAYKKPRKIDFMDQLPKNATGKISKNVLREPYWEDHDRRV